MATSRADLWSLLKTEMKTYAPEAISARHSTNNPTTDKHCDDTNVPETLASFILGNDANFSTCLSKSADHFGELVCGYIFVKLIEKRPSSNL